MAREMILVAVAALICAARAAPEPAVTILGQESPNVAFVPQEASRTARILRLESDSAPDGTFSYAYETENGIAARVEGSVTKGADQDHDIQSIKGQYSYTGPDGIQYTVQYIADENGFQAFGDHLPTPPPIPEAIHRSLDHNAAHPEEDNSILSASPALAPTPILGPATVQALLPDPFPTKLPPRVVATSRSVPPASLSKFNNIVTSTPAPPPRPSTLPPQLKQQQQLATTQLLAQTQVLQQQQLQQQAQEQLQQQQLQAQQFPPQQFQLQALQPQQFQPQQFAPQPLQPQQFQLQQLQPQSLQQQQFAAQQFNQPQQLQPQQLQPQQLQPQQLQPQQLQPQQLQPQQFQIPQLQPQGLLNQFTSPFQTFQPQRRTFTTA